MNRASARFLTAALLFAAGAFAFCSRSVHAQPALSHVSPGAATPGKTIEITLHGTKLSGPTRVWTSFPAQVEIAPPDPNTKDLTQVTCKLTLSAGVPLGIGGIVVANAGGGSDVLYLMIDDLPSVADGGKNHEAAQPQDIALPVAIDGQCDGTLADYYRFTASKGEQFSCEVVATRLGWDFDPLVRILDDKGHELLLADDEPASGSDSRFAFTAPADGTYTLELRDNRFKSGGRYRLRLGDFPLVSTPQPLVVQRGVPTEIAFRGPLVHGSSDVSVLPIGPTDGMQEFQVGLKLPGGLSSGWCRLNVSDLPVCPEESRLNIPCFASGVLQRATERDAFPLRASKGTPLRFKAITRSAGSPAILSLRLLDASGKQLAESPVTESDEPVLSYTPAADGAYQLAVEELAGRGGSDFTYAVECRSGPQFSLLLKNDKNNLLKHALPKGGTFDLDVQCQRVGFDGPITLSIVSPRAGWQVSNNVIATKTNEVKMRVQAPADFGPGELTNLRVIGQATGIENETQAEMTTTLQLRAARTQLPYPPQWHNGTIFVSGKDGGKQ